MGGKKRGRLLSFDFEKKCFLLPFFLFFSSDLVSLIWFARGALGVWWWIFDLTD